jgi:hypothetical protein
MPETVHRVRVSEAGAARSVVSRGAAATTEQMEQANHEGMGRIDDVIAASSTAMICSPQHSTNPCK